MTETGIVVLGQNRLFLQGLANLLGQSGFTILAQADSLDALTATPPGENLAKRAEVVLVDMPEDAQAIADGVGSIHESLSQAVILVLSDTLCPRCLSASLSSGAQGYLLKTISVDALVHSIELARLGETVLPTKLASMLVNGAQSFTAGHAQELGRAGLSDRETQILACLVGGNSNKMIANRLHITEATVKVHMKSLLRKIKVNNRTQAAIWAVNNGVTPPASIAAE